MATRRRLKAPDAPTNSRPLAIPPVRRSGVGLSMLSTSSRARHLPGTSTDLARGSAQFRAPAGIEPIELLAIRYGAADTKACRVSLAGKSEPPRAAPR